MSLKEVKREMSLVLLSTVLLAGFKSFRSLTLSQGRIDKLGNESIAFPASTD